MSDNGIVGSVMGSKGFVVGSFEFTGAAVSLGAGTGIFEGLTSRFWDTWGGSSFNLGQLH